MAKSSLEVTDAASAAVAVAPRVTLDDIKENIIEEHYFVASEMIVALNEDADVSPSLDVLTICLLVCKNGFVVIGKAAPAVEANFNREIGRKFAYEDAVRQLWPIMGYELRQRQMNLQKASDVE